MTSLKLIVAAALLAIGQSACGSDTQTTQRASAKSSDWKVEQSEKVRSFKPLLQPGGRSECLGRLSFAVREDLEWAVDPLSKVEDAEPVRFEDGVAGEGLEHLAYGPLVIWVSQKAGAKDLQEYATRLASWIKDTSTDEWRQAIAADEVKLANARKEGRTGTVFVMEERIAEARKRLGIAENRQKLQVGLDGAVTYDDGKGVIRTKFMLGDHIFTVLRTHPSLREGDPEREKMLAELRSILSRIRARAPGEVPSEPGVCLPYAFITDDGKGDYQAHATFRYADHPGVIYTIDTGLKRPADMAGTGILPTPAPVRVYSYLPATLADFSGQARQVKPLAPRGADIGPYRSDQGGVSLNVAKVGEPDVITYSIFTGVQGIDGWQTAPFIGVEMRSYTKMQYPQLPENPPPMAESQQRLDALLKSMHFRKTVPESEEFSRLLGERSSASRAD